MFQSALIRRHAGGGKLVDAGTIAETLLFYQGVHIVADKGLLTDLLREICPDSLVRMLTDGSITMTYSWSIPAVLTNTENYVSTHSFAAVRMTGHANGRRIRDRDEVQATVESHMGKSRSSRAISKSLLEKLTFQRVGPQTQEESLGAARQELGDENQTTKTVATLLDFLVPSYTMPRGFYFRVTFADTARFYVVTNLDYEAVNRERQIVTGEAGNIITDAFLLSHILNANVDMNLAANYMSELVTSDETSVIIRSRLQYMLARRDRSLRHIALFQESVLDDARAVREAINSGERTFADFLPILDKAHRFKTWLSERNPDSNLLSEYYKAVSGDLWISRLPAKTLRYIITVAAGLAGPASGLIAGGVDEFFIDRLLGGWRPNQFVQGPLRRFTIGG